MDNYVDPFERAVYKTFSLKRIKARVLCRYRENAVILAGFDLQALEADFPVSGKIIFLARRALDGVVFD